MNKVLLVGNLARDPETRTTNAGVTFTNFTVACQRRIANQQGIRDADFINCVAWRQTAEFVAKYFSKGSRIGVEGTLQVRNYEAQDGSKRHVTEVVVEHVEFVGSKEQQPEGPKANAPQVDDATGFNVIDDDKLPF